VVGRVPARLRLAKVGGCVTIASPMHDLKIFRLVQTEMATSKN